MTDSKDRRVAAAAERLRKAFERDAAFSAAVTHWCENPGAMGSWTPETQAELDSAKSVPELRRIWKRLEAEGRVDSYGSSEWYHARLNLKHKPKSEGTNG
jgi:hypothetical protein